MGLEPGQWISVSTDIPLLTTEKQAVVFRPGMLARVVSVRAGAHVDYACPETGRIERVHMQTTFPMFIVRGLINTLPEPGTSIGVPWKNEVDTIDWTRVIVGQTSRVPGWQLRMFHFTVATISLWVDEPVRFEQPQQAIAFIEHMTQLTKASRR